MAEKYNDLVYQPPYMQMKMKADQSVIFNGIFTEGQEPWGHPMNIGLQIVTHPFVSDNPTHLHNFQEYLAWYGTNPDDPTDFGGEVVIYLGEDKVKYVITQPTVISLPPGFVHCPLEITRIDRPIIQLEIMLPPADGAEPTRQPFFEEDFGFTTEGTVDIKRTPIIK